MLNIDVNSETLPHSALVIWTSAIFSFCQQNMKSFHSELCAKFNLILNGSALFRTCTLSHSGLFKYIYSSRKRFFNGSKSFFSLTSLTSWILNWKVYESEARYRLFVRLVLLQWSCIWMFSVSFKSPVLPGSLAAAVRTSGVAASLSCGSRDSSLRVSFFFLCGLSRFFCPRWPIWRLSGTAAARRDSMMGLRGLLPSNSVCGSAGFM